MWCDICWTFGHPSAREKLNNVECQLDENGRIAVFEIASVLGISCWSFWSISSKSLNMHTFVPNWHGTPAHSVLSVCQFLANKMTLGPPPGVVLCYFFFSRPQDGIKRKQILYHHNSSKVAGHIFWVVKCYSNFACSSHCHPSPCPLSIPHPLLYSLIYSKRCSSFTLSHGILHYLTRFDTYKYPYM